MLRNCAVIAWPLVACATALRENLALGFIARSHCWAAPIR